ncbi:MAG: hypothetical protein ACREJT_06485, partial [Myxococcota bacterium]
MKERERRRLGRADVLERRRINVVLCERRLKIAVIGEHGAWRELHSLLVVAHRFDVQRSLRGIGRDGDGEQLAETFHRDRRERREHDLIRDSRRRRPMEDQPVVIDPDLRGRRRPRLPPQFE